MSATVKTEVWGTDPDMNALEALMWRAEADPRLRSTMVAIEELDQAPDWDRFVNAHEWATRLIPRFRMKVAEPAFGVGRPSWTLDKDFDLHYHVRRIGLPVPGAFSDVLATAQQIAMTPFDKHRPPWEAVLVDGLPDGRAAYVLKLHHSATDGIGATQLLGMVHSRQREPNPDRPKPGPLPSSDGSSLGTLARQVGHDAKSLAGLAADVARGATALRRPDRVAADAVRYADSLRRVLSDPEADASPLLAGRSLSWRFGAMDVDFADLRAAAKSVGGTINDAYMAALMGGFRLYHEQMGQPIQTMPVAMPISVRRDGDDTGGNRFVGARFAGPVGVTDPKERIREIKAIVAEARTEPAAEGLGLLTPLLSRLPGPILQQATGGFTRSNDLQASNVPGIREDIFMAGARIVRAYPYAPLPGCASMITLLSHGTTCCIGTNLDPAAITEPDRFARCLADGFSEVLALGGDGFAPPVRRA